MKAREDLDGAEGAVTVVVAIFERCAKSDLFGGGEDEEGFCNGELLVDLKLGEADIGNVEEAWHVSYQSVYIAQGLTFLPC